MYPSTSPSSDQLLWSLQSRKLLIRPLLHNSQSPPLQPPVHNPLLPATPQQTPAATEPYNPPPTNGFDANVVMVLSVLLCALICSLGLNSIIRCALRCSSFVVTEPTDSQNTTNPISTSTTTACSRLANTGIKKKALKTFPTVTYSADMKLPGLDTECVICLSDFAPGERVRLLPKCNHGFHVRCIDRWLNSHSSCPTCRNCLIETCQKIVGCSQASSSEQPPAQALPQETAISLAPPLQPVPRETAISLAPPLQPVPRETAISLAPPLQPVPQETATSLAPLEREDPSRNPRIT